MSCGLALDDAAYVLGALSPAERLAFERHLAGCTECTRSVRELAGLPGLLGRVDATVLDEPPPEVPVPDTLLPALSAEVGRARRRRTTLGLGLAAAAALVAGALPVVVAQIGDEGSAPVPPTATSPSTGPATAMQPVGDVPVEADLVMEQVLWGTRLNLICTYNPGSAHDLPPTVDYTLFVRTRDGGIEQVGSWRSVTGRTMRLSAATAASRQEIASVEVRTPDGRVLLESAT